ncbi:MAG TPA: UDP-3-O-(3-hydroxymyristoyl)glucosamine N-acyltransferase [Chitinophagaceae bacterium]
MTNPIRLEEIISTLGQEFQVVGNPDVTVDKVSKPEEADRSSIVWFSSLPHDLQTLLDTCDAGIMILPLPLPEKIEVPRGKALIFTRDSRLAIMTIMARFFRQRPDWGRHPTAVIHPQAVIAKDVHIGPNSYVGKCTIGSGSILYGNNFIYDGVTIGNDVTIHAGTVIGTDGFGYQPDEKEHWLKFEHLGGVEIGNGVEIGSNTCIDRGTLGNTKIGDGTKIDNLVHIAHNVQIGRHCLVIAHAMIGGSCIIGDFAWISPNAGILQKQQIGEHAIVGLGAVVIRDVPANETWAGVPARKMEQKPNP